MKCVDVLRWEEESEKVLLSLLHWGNCALDYDRQRSHLLHDIPVGDQPAREVVEAQTLTKKPKVKVPHDDELDDGTTLFLPIELWYPPTDDEAEEAQEGDDQNDNDNEHDDNAANADGDDDDQDDSSSSSNDGSSSSSSNDSSD